MAERGPILAAVAEQPAATGPREDLVALPESVPQPRPGEQPAGRPDPSEQMTVTIYLRLPETDPAAGPPAPSPDAVRGAEEHARRCGLTVQPGLAPEAVRVSGPVEAIERCFGVRLALWRAADGSTGLAPEGPVLVPRALAGDVVAVLGLDTRPVARRSD